MKTWLNLLRGLILGYKEYCRLTSISGNTKSKPEIKISMARFGFVHPKRLAFTIRVMYRKIQALLLMRFRAQYNMKLRNAAVANNPYLVWMSARTLMNKPLYFAIRPKIRAICYPYIDAGARNKARLPWGVYFQVFALLAGFYLLFNYSSFQKRFFSTSSAAALQSTEEKHYGMLPVMNEATATAYAGGISGGVGVSVALTNVTQPEHTPTPAALVQPTVTPYPTYTPYPTFTPAPRGGTYLSVGYSYYWPLFGPPNCSEGGWKDNYCSDTVLDGKHWEEFIGKGVAIPPAYLDILPLGSWIYVHSPKEMIGKYQVITTCADCIKKEGHVYFDFLDNRMRLAWTVPMLIEVLP